MCNIFGICRAIRILDIFYAENRVRCWRLGSSWTDYSQSIVRYIDDWKKVYPILRCNPCYFQCRNWDQCWSCKRHCFAFCNIVLGNPMYEEENVLFLDRLSLILCNYWWLAKNGKKWRSEGLSGIRVHCVAFFIVSICYDPYWFLMTAKVVFSKLTQRKSVQLAMLFDQPLLQKVWSIRFRLLEYLEEKLAFNNRL